MQIEWENVLYLFHNLNRRWLVERRNASQRGHIRENIHVDTKGEEEIMVFMLEQVECLLRKNSRTAGALLKVVIHRIKTQGLT